MNLDRDLTNLYIFISKAFLKSNKGQFQNNSLWFLRYILIETQCRGYASFNFSPEPESLYKVQAILPMDYHMILILMLLTWQFVGIIKKTCLRLLDKISLSLLIGWGLWHCEPTWSLGRGWARLLQVVHWPVQARVLYSAVCWPVWQQWRQGAEARHSLICN